MFSYIWHVVELIVVATFLGLMVFLSILSPMGLVVSFVMFVFTLIFSPYYLPWYIWLCGVPISVFVGIVSLKLFIRVAKDFVSPIVR